MTNENINLDLYVLDSLGVAYQRAISTNCTDQFFREAFLGKVQTLLSKVKCCDDLDTLDTLGKLYQRLGSTLRPDNSGRDRDVLVGILFKIEDLLRNVNVNKLIRE